MKKVLVTGLFMIMGWTQLNAQISLTPMVKTGVHFSKLINISSDYRAEYYAGAGLSLNLTKRYTLQPELSYLRQGASNIRYDYSYYNNNKNYTVLNSVDDSFAASYVSMNLINKFWIGEGKLNIHFGPSIDVLITEFENSDNDFDVAFNVGTEVKIIKNLNAEVRLRLGLIEPYEKVSDSELYELFAPFDNLQTYSSIQAGLVYVLDFELNEESEIE